MRSFPEILFTFQQKVKDASVSLEEINCKYEQEITSQKQQEVVDKILEISHSERRHELKKVLDRVECKSQLETILLELVMSCLDKVADQESLKSKVQELEQKFNALEERKEEVKQPE